MNYSPIRYAFKYLYYRLLLFFECSRGRWSFFLSEFIHLFSALRIPIEMPTKNTLMTVVTKWGTFRFIGDLYGHIILHPAFERQDKEVLLQLMRSSLYKSRTILFLDIGAFVGDYTISISNTLKSKKISYLVFEPDIDYFQLLKENIAVNSLKNIKIFNYGLSRKNSIIEVDRFPGDPKSEKLHFKLRTLDSLFPVDYFREFDEIYIKIDIEGQELDCLGGAGNLFKSKRKITILIEDYLDPALKGFLQTKGFRFLQKVSPYNSFWLRSYETK